MKTSLAGILVLMITIFFFSFPAMATNGHQLMGIGAYGKSMGGAVTAAPFDTTTVITNPAGLTKLDSRADFNFEMFMPTRSVDFTSTGGNKSEGGSDRFLVPAVGWSAPTNKDKTSFFGGGMFAVSGMGVDYDSIYTFPHPVMQAMGIDNLQKGSIYTQYQFWKMSPAFAKKINSRFSAGISLNIDYHQMSYKQWFVDPNGKSGGIDLATPGNAMGWGFSLGALYDVSHMLTVGATYISKQYFKDMEYRLQEGDVYLLKDFNPNNPPAATFYKNTDGIYKWSGMDFPQQIAIGLAFRPSKLRALTITLDYKWIDFSDTFDEQELKGHFNIVDLSDSVIDTTSSYPLNFGWSDVDVYAIGIQYQIGDSDWIRFGYNHGDSPIKCNDVFNNMAFPAIAKHHFTIGGTKSIGNYWQLHGTYMHVKNESLTENGPDQPPVRISLKENSFILGITYLF